MWGTTSHPAKHPARNSGTLVKKNPSPYFSSRRVRPGTKNAQTWYSQTGLETMTPTVTAISIFRSNALVTAV
jgi:hypothetical protein